MQIATIRIKNRARPRGFAGRLLRLWHWMLDLRDADQSRAAKRQLALEETLVLGPKQRVHLLRCGTEQFLAGTGADGVLSLLRVGQVPPNEAVKGDRL
jgi:hypothetical protein